MAIKNLGRVVGADGKSAYQIWLDNGNKGTEQDFLDSLKAPVNELEKTLQDILTIIQGGELSGNQVADIEQLIVSYFENKTVKEVER